MVSDASAPTRRSRRDSTVRVLVICTGNTCRSPFAEYLLRADLDGLPVTVASAGTHASAGARMMPEMRTAAAKAGISLETTADHRSAALTVDLVRSSDLVLTMTREQRREVVLLSPDKLTSTFTLNEFARLAQDMSDDAIGRSRARAHTNRGRVRNAVHEIAAHRATAPPVKDPDVDNIADPMARGMRAYRKSVREIAASVPQVERVLRSLLD